MPEKDSVLASLSIMERFSLGGRVCFLTGAGSGIGRAIAHALADAGASIALVDKDGDTANVVAREIEQRHPGTTTLVIQADVTEKKAVEAAVSQTVAELGDLTVGFNNAGIGQWVDSVDLTEEDLKTMFDVNAHSVFYGAVAQARHMMKNGYGKIINTASISAHIANHPQSQAHYNAAKAAVIGMTKSHAVEWVDHGIRVNTFSPGYTRTKLVDDLLETELGQQVYPVWMAETPMKRMADPTDLQGVAVFLASAASDYVTGTDIVVDGGYLAT